MKILIIEDEPSLREIMQRALVQERYVVETASTYSEADAKIAAYSYDCILLDIMLPDGNGLQLLKHLKELRKRENIIIISARDSLDDKILGLEGVDNFPFVKFDCYNNQHLAYAELGDYKNAYNTLLKSNEIRDNLWAQEKTESLRDLTIKYETKETQLALAQSEAKRANIMMWLFAALAILLIGAVIFVIYAARQKRRRLQREMEFAKIRADIGRKLTQQYIEGLENERQRMARELHDGVCNDLLAIQMNIKAEKPSQSTASMIDSCRESVRRISHELMPPEFTYASLDEVVRFFISKQADVNKEKITFLYGSSAIDSDWGEVADASALEIYRIIQEAVGNAVKHSGADKINVKLSLTKEKLEAIIIDNGSYQQKVSTGKNGIGLDSIRRRANVIGGTISVSANELGGTTVKLTMIFLKTQ